MNVQGIAKRAILVSLNMGQWGSGKVDQEATRLVHTANKASANAGRYTKNLIDPAALKGIRQAQSAMRDFHYTNTMPWTDSGWRLLPTGNYMHYEGQMMRLSRNVEDEVSKFVANYDNHVANARNALASMFNAGDYPDASDIESRFYTKVSKRAIPTGSDIRVDLTAEQEQSIRDQVNGETKLAIAEAMRDPWRRIMDTLGNTIEALSSYGEEIPGSSKTRTFRDSAIGNVKELCETLRRLDMDESGALARAIDDLHARIDGVVPEDLRRDGAERAEVVARLEEARQLAEFCFGR